MIIAVGSEGEPADAICPESLPIAISGGGSMDDKGGPLQTSAPITKGRLSANGERPVGWRVRSAEGSYTAYALCSAGGARGGGEEGETEGEREAAEKEAAAASAK